MIRRRRILLYPFGYGLSYTTFQLSNLRIEKAGADVKVSLDVRNTGRRAGAEVVQIYVGQANPSVPRPLRELKGFSKVMLDPDQTRRVEITLPQDAFHTGAGQEGLDGGLRRPIHHRSRRIRARD